MRRLLWSFEEKNMNFLQVTMEVRVTSPCKRRVPQVLIGMYQRKHVDAVQEAVLEYGIPVFI